MNCSGIGRAQLVEDLRGYKMQLVGDVEFFAVNVGWHGRAKLNAVKGELRDVSTFLALWSPRRKKLRRAPSITRAWRVRAAHITRAFAARSPLPKIAV